MRSISLFAMTVIGISTISANSFAVVAPIAKSRSKIVRTFDGQNFICEHPADVGRVAYRKTGESGVIRSGKVEVTFEFETLKCTDQASGPAFVTVGLEGRHINRFNGFAEYPQLGLVAYTPDLKVYEIQPVSLKNGKHSLTYTFDASAFPGLLARNVKANGEHTVVIAMFLRGLVYLGDARTGEVQQRDYVGFGSYMVTLSEKNGTLAFANQPRSFPTP